MIYFQFSKKRLMWIKERTGKALSWMSISVFLSMTIDFITFLTVHSQSRLQRRVHNENNCRLVFLEIWYKYQQRHIMLTQLHTNPNYLFLRMLSEGQEPLWWQVQQLHWHQSQPSITTTIKSNTWSSSKLLILKLRNRVLTSVCILSKKFFWYSILPVGSIFTTKIYTRLMMNGSSPIRNERRLSLGF